MKKKILVLALSFGMLLSMVACGDSSGNKSDGVNATESTQDDGKKDNVEVSEKLQEVQSKYSTDVAGSPDEIKNLEITVFGKEFQTGQTFQEYYEIFEQKAQEYGYELEECDIDYDMEPGSSSNPRLYFEYCYQKRIGIDFVVTNATDDKKPLRQCQIIQISITYDNIDESYNQYKEQLPSDMFVVNGISYKDMDTVDRALTVLDTAEHLCHETLPKDGANDIYVEASGKGQLFKQFLYQNHNAPGFIESVSIVYGANYFETEETIEDNSSKYCDSAIRHSIGLKLEKVYKEDDSYYADVTVVDHDGAVSDEKLSCSEKSGKYISGYNIANDIASKELPIRYNVVEDGYGLINVSRIVEYPDTATCKCNIISGLKNGDKLKILITELSYDSCVYNIGETFYNYEVNKLDLSTGGLHYFSYDVMECDED